MVCQFGMMFYPDKPKGVPGGESRSGARWAPPVLTRGIVFGNPLLVQIAHAGDAGAVLDAVTAAMEMEFVNLAPRRSHAPAGAITWLARASQQ